MRLPRTRPIMFFNARILTEKGVVASSMRVAGSRVAALDCSPGPDDFRIDLRGDLVIPGLINAHDHLELNNFPRLKWRERYDNVREWIDDFQPRFKTDVVLVSGTSVPIEDRLLVGGIKNLLSGVTTVCHHNPLHASMRRNFPVRVVTRVRYCHSLLLEGGAVRRVYNRTPRAWPWIIHAAEGTDEEAQKELDRLMELDCVGPNTVLVHAVGLGQHARELLQKAGGAIVWCPSSNYFLLGTTAEVTDLARAGRVALGTDSRLSGGRDMLAEIGIAAETKQVGAESILRMVTVDAARILRLQDSGTLREGAFADLLVLPGRRVNPFDDVVVADRSRIRLVLLGGRAQIADIDLWQVFTATRVKSSEVCLDGRRKLMAASLVERVRRIRVREPGLEC
jgi:cytosine/adenosine deaminase-related metal-dependent hydrolase